MAVFSNSASDSLIAGSDGRDSIYNDAGDNVTINAGAGDDTILNNHGYEVSISGGEGNDSITNDGSHSTIDGGAGDDTIYNDYGDEVSISGGEGNDSITNDGSHSTINGGDGDDTINNQDYDSLIDGGNGNDSIKNYGSSVSIDGGAGNDSISNDGSYSTINGGDGDDTIENQSYRVEFLYSEGDGNDLITGFNEGSVLKIDAESYSTMISGDDIIVTVGKNTITLAGAANLDLESVNIFSSRIKLTDGDDEFYNNASNVSIDAGTGNDYIENYNGESVTLNGGDGNDTIYSEWSSNVSINGGAGNDFIGNYSQGDNASINGGTGDDSIVNQGDNVTFTYTEGDGNDTISNEWCVENLTLKIGDGTGTYSTVQSDNDLLVKVGEGTITFKNAYMTSDSININSDEIALENKPILLGDGDDSIEINRKGMTVDGGNGNDYIYAYNQNSTSDPVTSINGGAGDDSIGSNFRNENVIINGGDGNDEIYNDSAFSTVNGGNGNDSIENSQGYSSSINGGAGDDSISNRADNVSINGDDGNDEIYNSGSDSTIDGGKGDDLIQQNYSKNILFKYSEGDGNDTITGFDATSTLQIGNGTGTYSTVESGMDIIVNVGENTVTLKDVYANTNTININGDVSTLENKPIELGDDDDYVEITRNGMTVDAGDGDDTLSNYYNYDEETGERVYYSDVKMSGGAGDDYISNDGNNVTIDGGEGNDYISNHDEGDDGGSTGGSNVSINGGDGDDTIQNEGGDNVTIEGGKGDDSVITWYYASNNNNVLYKYTEGDGNDYIESFNSTSSLQIGDGTGTYSTQSSGNDLLVHVGEGTITLKNVYTTTDSVRINGTKINLETKTVVMTDDNERVRVTRDFFTIDAGNGDDTLDNDGSRVSINGGEGDDQINNGNYGGGHRATLDGGNGSDTIDNYGGANVLINGGANDDEIRNKGDNATIDAGEGNDSIRNYGSDVTMNGGEGDDTISNEYNYYYDENDERQTLSGNNSTINAGTGDDSIYNSWQSKNVTFIYNDGDGSDTINGFNGDSTLKIGNGTGTYSTQMSGSDIIVNVGNGSILLEEAASNLSTLHINNDAIEIDYQPETDTDADSDSDTDSDSDVDIEYSVKAYTASDDEIKNTDIEVIIEALAGNDNIVNFAPYVKIDAGIGRDYVSNLGDNVSIAGGDGNDTISTGEYYDEDAGYYYSEGGNKVTVDGGAGNDYISADGYGNVKKVTLRGGDGADTIEIASSNYTKSLIDGGADDDSIRSSTSDSTINGGDGEDTIDSNGDKVTLDAGKGDDSIDSYGNNVSIDGGAGNDSIESGGSNVTIDAGKGNDEIYSYGSKVTINAGEGNDEIYFRSDTKDNLIVYNAGDGNDIIEGFNATSTLSITGDTYSTQISGNDFLVTVGENTVTLKNVLLKTEVININDENIPLEVKNIELTDGDDTVDVGISSIVVDAGAGNDYIENSGNGVEIYGRDGNDIISNSGSTVTIDAGDGNNYIYNNGKNVLIESYDGNDEINNSGDNITIDSGEGDDSIDNIGSNVTITAGDGSDTIENSRWGDADNVSIDAGAGDDSVYSRGFTNVTIDAGDGKDTVELDYYESDKISVNGGAGDDSIYNYEVKNATIGGGEGNDTITLELRDYDKPKNIIVYNAGDGNDLVEGFNETATLSITGGTYTTEESGRDILVHVGEGTITLANVALRANKIHINDDEIEFESNVIELTGGNDSIWNYRKSSSILGGAGSDTVYNDAENVTIDAGTGDDSVYNYGDNATIDAGNGDDTVSNGGDDVTISGGAGNDSIENEGNNTTIEGGTGDDTISIISDGWGDKEHNLIIYTAGDGNDLIEGFNETTTLNIIGSEYSSIATANDDIILTVGTGKITLSGALMLDNVNIEVTYPEWKFDGKKAVYGTNKKTFVTVEGVTSKEGLTIDGTTVKVAASVLNKANVTISKGYTLALEDDVQRPTTTAKFDWNIDGTTATYIKTSTTEGYTVEDNQIVYKLDVVPETLITVEGVKSKEGLTVTDKVVTVAASSLSQDKAVIISGDEYKLALAEEVPKTSIETKGWAIDENNVATYTTDSTMAGYALSADSKSITYTPASGNELLVTVTGVKSFEGLTLDTENKIVTVAAAALNQSNVTVSKGYTLALADGIAEPTIAVTDWNFKGTTAKYQEGLTTEGYTLDTVNNQINYTPSSEGTTLLELGGVDTTGKPTIEGNKVILSDDSFIDEKTPLSLVKNPDNNYEFEFATGNYFGTIFIGSDERDVITNKGEDINFDLGAGKDSVINSNNNVSINSGDGNDKINNTGSQVTIEGGKGNDNITLSGGDGGNIFVYTSGDGKDNLYGFKKNDTIKIADNSQVESSLKGKDVVFKVGNGSITVKNGTQLNSAIKIVGADDKDIEEISGNNYTTDGIISNVQSGDKKIILTEDLEEYTVDRVRIIDGSQNKAGIKIDGSGVDEISLIGGAGKDTLISGINSEFQLTGGKGNDVFVFKGGNGTITDYSQKGTYGKDKIDIDEGLTFEDFEVKGREVIFTYKDSDNISQKLTIEDGAGKEITIRTKIGSKTYTAVNRYDSIGIFDSNGKAVSVAGTAESFSAVKYSKIETIDGSAANEVKIIGNKKANYIKAGSGGSTINGGKGNDTLVGGDGNDIFVYDNKSGNKLIQNFDSDKDTISLTSGASISEVKTINKNTDLELKIGNSKVTIASGAGKSFTFIDDDGEKTFTTNGLLVRANGNFVSLTSSFAGNKFNMADYEKYNSVNAGLLKKAFNLIGDGDTESLIGGKGNDTLTAGGGDSTLWGGKGNDILIGNEAAQDTFIFRAGEGSDTIYGFNSGGALDELMILDKRGKESTYNKAVFSGDPDNGTLILSIKGGGKVLLEGISASESIKINGKTHIISGKKLN